MPSVAVVAGAIIRQRTDNFDQSTYHDRHQEALQLLEAEVHAERARYAAAAAARDFETAVVYTGEAIDMMHSVEPAEAILHRVVAGPKPHWRDALIESTAAGSAEPNASCVPWYRK